MALIAIGYNRLDDYRRLVNSLLDADYGGDAVDIVMSIDNSGDNSVERYARTIAWPHGRCFVRTFGEHMGLKRHILSCGEYLNTYEVVVVFEDDVVASPNFYAYVLQCVQKYGNQESIAGISLYGDMRNKHCQLPFTPQPTGYDVYFTQNAQSWGQVWMRHQWRAFIEWMGEESQRPFEAGVHLPQIVNDWGEDSWLKYHLKYCAENDKYFVCPYTSLTTCFSSVGTHSHDTTSAFQVPLLMGDKKAYSLPEFGDCRAAYYDAFFERKYDISLHLGLDESDVKVDLYGINTADDEAYRYVLSSRRLPYETIASYGRRYRPHELNVLLDYSGACLHLYDTTKRLSLSKRAAGSYDRVDQYIYFHDIYSNTKLLVKAAIRVAIKTVKATLTRT